MQEKDRSDIDTNKPRILNYRKGGIVNDGSASST